MSIELQLEFNCQSLFPRAIRQILVVLVVRLVKKKKKSPNVFLVSDNQTAPPPPPAFVQRPKTSKKV